MSASETFLDERAARGTSGPILGMVLFVASEAMFFAALFGVYFSLQAQAKVWPPAAIPIPDLPVPIALTVILVSSSVVLQIGLRTVQRAGARKAMVWLGATIVLGAAFLLLQLYDYSQLGFGVKDGVFGSLFYVMTGLHMAHVIGGVVFLSIVLSQALTGQLSLRRHEPVEAAAIYWHFVDVVWIGLFIVFYVLTQTG